MLGRSGVFRRRLWVCSAGAGSSWRRAWGPSSRREMRSGLRDEPRPRQSVDVNLPPPELIWGLLARGVALVYFISFASMTNQILTLGGLPRVRPALSDRLVSPGNAGLSDPGVASRTSPRFLVDPHNSGRRAGLVRVARPHLRRAPRSWRGGVQPVGVRRLLRVLYLTPSIASRT